MPKSKNNSPARKLRGIKRLLSFVHNKHCKETIVKKILSISSQQSFSILPDPSYPNLTAKSLTSINIFPRAVKKPKMEIVRVQSTTVLPRKVYHPTIINACQAMFAKHPSQLVPEEVTKFKFYRNMKIQNRDPIESDVIYLPIGGIRTCLNCGELTWTDGFSSPSYSKRFFSANQYSVCLTNSKTWMFV